MAKYTARLQPSKTGSFDERISINISGLRYMDKLVLHFQQNKNIAAGSSKVFLNVVEYSNKSTS